MNQQKNGLIKSSKNTWTVIGLVILITTIIDSGVYGWQSSSKSADIQWIKYENPKYNYSLKYPQNWIIEALNPVYVTLNSPKNEQIKQSIESNQIRGSGYMPDITIAFYSSVKGWGAETLEEIINKNPFISDARKIDFAGSEAWEMIMGGDGEVYTILI